MPADWTQPDMVLQIKTKPGLKFDLPMYEIKAGSKIRLVFNNNDDMMHNIVGVMPGTAVSHPGPLEDSREGKTGSDPVGRHDAGHGRL